MPILSRQRQRHRLIRQVCREAVQVLKAVQGKEVQAPRALPDKVDRMRQEVREERVL
jgi:hypothetical protein